MAFKKGDKKPENSGRKKGVSNKKKIPKVADFLAQKDINPAQKILDIIEENERLPEPDQMSPGMKISIWMDLLEYCQPKPKEFEKDDDLAPEELQEAPTETLLKIIRDNNGAS